MSMSMSTSPRAQAIVPVLHGPTSSGTHTHTRLVVALVPFEVATTSLACLGGHHHLLLARVAILVVAARIIRAVALVLLIVQMLGGRLLLDLLNVEKQR